MDLSTKPTEPVKNRITTRELAVLAVCTAALFGLQLALAPLPNIEVVSLLIMLYTRWFRHRALWIVCVFAVLEGVFYGFGLWWVTYLYVWPLLWLTVTLLGKEAKPPLFWAAVSGFYGLAFGFLCSFLYLAVGGVHTAAAWWLAGIPFDLVHSCGNFVLAMILYHPLDTLYHRFFGVPPS